MAMSSNITIEGCDPTLGILGATQRFAFDATDPLVRLEAFGQFVPIIGTNSVINIELRNSNFAGFRLKQTSATTDTFAFGKFEFQYYVNDADTTGTTIWQYSPGTTTGTHSFYSGSPPSSNSLVLKLDSTAAIFSVPVYGRRVSGLMYFSGNTTATSSIPATTWVKVSGTTTFAATGSEVSMPSNNRLTFTTSDSSSPTPTLFVNADFVFTNSGTTGSACIISFAIYKNGTTLIAPNSNTTMVASDTSYHSVSLRVLTTANTTDYFELWVMSSVANTTGIIVTNGSISLEAA